MDGSGQRGDLLDTRTRKARFVYPTDPDQHLLHKPVEAQWLVVPDTIAVVYEDECLTYAALESASAVLAQRLQVLGIRPETRVAIALERGLELVIGVLGVLKAGGAYVPLDMNYPPERLEYILRDANIQAIVTQKALIDRLPSMSIPLLFLDTFSHAVLDHQPVSVAQIQPENCAYVIYTSGSTGQPKGSEVSHRAVYHTLCEYNQNLEIHSGMRLLQFAALGFDATVLEIFSPLYASACLVLAQREHLEPGPLLLETLRRTAITGAIIPPSALAVLPRAELPDLRLLLSAGEAVSARVVSHWAPGRRFYNAYGLTETAVCTTLALCQEDEAAPPIGRPMGETRVLYLLDEALQPVQEGEIGGIFIGGISLARGYLGKPELTADRFLPDPFSGIEGARLYRTGDLGRYRSDGQLLFIGREDQQIKIRGFRIELGEIEAALIRHPLVREAVVIARADIPGERFLVAYFTSVQMDTQPSTQDLRAYLKVSLPDYMIPSVFVPLAFLPLTSHGKLDRRALPAPTRSESYDAPRTQNELLLTQLWETLFDQPRIGIHENFFELGGHSLLITQLVVRIQEVFGIVLPMASVFSAPTITELANSLEMHQVQVSPENTPPLRAISRQLPLPLSFSQEQVWFLLQLDPQNQSYNAQALIELHGKLDLEALECGLNEIVRRHEIFRTTFEERDNHPLQIIHAFLPFRLPVIDLQEFQEQKREPEAERLIQAEIRRPFVITQLPLVRWLLLRLDASTAWLLHVEHHLVHDGWSFTVFVRELLALYQAFSVHQPSPLPELPIQFADFAYWQRQWMQGDILENQIAYWKQRLAGSHPLLQLPIDRPRPPVQSSHGAALRIQLAPSLYTDLKALSQREGTTLFLTMLTALFILLYRYTGQEDICVGSGVANRRWKESEALIGMLVNTIVLRSNLSENPSFRALLQQVHTTTLEAYLYQDLPFDKLVNTLQPERNLSYNPLFQVIFGFHDSPLPDLELPDLTLKLREGLNNGSAKFDLGVVVIPRGEQHPGKKGEDSITLIWEYNTDLFQESTMQRMASCYESVLNEIVQHPDQRIADLALLSTSQREQLLLAWNTTEVLATPQLCLHQRIEQQAERTPDACALWINGCGLTYQVLNERANQLACQLQQRGIGADQLVALYLPRSLEMVIGQLAILKAGGAYVPLDPDHPRDRLTFLLEDMRARIVLTTRSLLSSLPQQRERIICLVEEQQVDMREEQFSNPLCQVGPEHLAYVIYTSGSTGKPKGASILHKGVCNLVDALATRCEMRTGERVLRFASLNFDASVLEIFTALTHGACLVLAEKEQLLPDAPLLELLRAEAITWTLLPPSTLAHLPPTALPDLHTLFSGGEACSASVIRNWAPGRNFYNAYGPTEASVCTTLARCTGTEISPPLGRPLPNTQIYILDTHLQPVPDGIMGELYIGGSGLARDYLHLPDLTAERFVPHPFSQEAGARLYRTGDLVRYASDEVLEFLGRGDNQVKIRGFRIEPGEIEATLLALPAVQNAVVMAREDRPGEKQLVAYIVLQPTASPDAKKLRHQIKSRLPDYMLPASLIFLDALPFLPNGKIDRRALPRPELVQSDFAGRYTEPQNELERAISAIWQEELHIEQISRDDNFFDLGGHSLAMVRVHKQMRAQLKQVCSLVDLFRYPTIDALARYLRAGEEDFTLQENLARAATRRATTQRQREFWFLQRNQREERGDEYEC